jgi:hypothetical protein
MTYIQSYKEKDEEVVCETHTLVSQELNAMCGGRCLYTGEQRAQLQRLKLMLEQMIAGEIECLPASAVCAKHYAILRR